MLYQANQSLFLKKIQHIQTYVTLYAIVHRTNNFIKLLLFAKVWKNIKIIDLTFFRVLVVFEFFIFFQFTVLFVGTKIT